MSHHPCRSPPLRCVRHALPKAPPYCVLAAAHHQPKHPSTHQATNRIISPTTTLVRTSPSHIILPPCTKGLRLQSNNSWLEITKRSPPKRDGLIPSSTTSIQLASTPPILPRWYLTDPMQWKAFVSGLPTLEPEQYS